jgi:Ca2+/Na+ antiporter
MSNFFQSAFQFFFLVGYIVLYIVSIIILRPFRLHRKRKKSTVSLKISYLLYLALFLVFTYLLLFGHEEPSEEDVLYDTLFNFHFLIFLTATIVPNIGIMVRKKIKKNRIEYNVMFTLINIFYFLYLLYLCISKEWALL